MGLWYSIFSGASSLATHKIAMVKPLAFKGDKKSKKRKASQPDSGPIGDSESQALVAPKFTAGTEEDDSWVTAEVATDVTGPVIFALPSAKPTCMACDANGKIFASEVENIVEGDLATAEPHDIRQVWIANRVAGTEELSFKGHHGRLVNFLYKNNPAVDSTEYMLTDFQLSQLRQDRCSIRHA